MPDRYFLAVAAVIGAAFTAALASLLRFVFRLPWSWAFAAGIALAVSSTILPNDIRGTICRAIVDVAVAVVSTMQLRRSRGWRWPAAFAAGVALFAVLGALTFPFETHAVRVDLPPAR